MNIDRRIEDDAAIVSGSDVQQEGAYDSSSSDDNDDPLHKQEYTQDDPMSYHYNPHQDDEDEAYVYRHLRGGTEETVTIRRRKIASQHDRVSNDKEKSTTQGMSISTKNKSTTKGDRVVEEATPRSTPLEETIGSDTKIDSTRIRPSKDNFTLEQAKILKPRYSDAVLSCPCCLQIVCMDCQRHERYTNQYRAMFVMNIGVCWDKYVVPEITPQDESKRTRTRRILNQEGRSTEISNGENVSDEDSDNGNEQGVYYSVYCNNCMTEVAALDMKDEVYHFFGCVASA
jgi:hypothetical protein